MRRLFFITLLAVFIITVGISAQLGAQTVQDTPQDVILTPAPEPIPQKPNNIWPIVASIIVAIFPLGVRLFQWLGVDIEKSAIYPILVKIIEIIAAVESGRKSLTGADKKKTVVELASKRLKQREINLLTKRYGNMEAAVQAAFEISSTAQKKTVNIASGGK